MEIARRAGDPSAIARIEFEIGTGRRAGLGAADVLVPVPAGADRGWASLTVTPTAAHGQAVCNFVVDTDPNTPAMDCTEAVDATQIPLVGFVAWERSFAANPDANYGRLVGHSYVTPVLP